MKTYTFNIIVYGFYTVDADTEEQARDMVENAYESGSIDPDHHELELLETKPCI